MSKAYREALNEILGRGQVQYLRCPCGHHQQLPAGTMRLECPKCGRVFGKPEKPHNQNRAMERRKRQMERQNPKPVAEQVFKIPPAARDGDGMLGATLGEDPDPPEPLRVVDGKERIP